MTECITREDVETIYRSLEECTELWADAEAWQLHAARSIERHIGGFVGLFMLGSCVDGSSKIFEYAATDNGYVRFSDFLSGGAEMAVPGAAKGFSVLRTQGVFCVPFTELAGGDYHRSDFYQYFMRPQSADETLCALALSSARTHINLSLSRTARDRPFNQRDIAVLGSFATAIAARCETRLATRAQLGEHGLTPRQKQTLRALLNGDSEKQIASSLGISLATAHQYVTKLHRHFAVNSRGELMAYFLRRSPVLARSKR